MPAHVLGGIGNCLVISEDRMELEDLKKLLKEYIASHYVKIGIKESVSRALFCNVSSMRMNFSPDEIFHDTMQFAFSREEFRKKIGNAGKPFDEYLRRLMNRKGITSSDIYDSRTGIDRQYLNKILNNKIKPSKQKLFALMLAMKLNIDEAKDFLNYAGFSFSENEISDLVVRFCIENGQFDIFVVNALLDENNEPPLS